MAKIGLCTGQWLTKNKKMAFLLLSRNIFWYFKLHQSLHFMENIGVIVNAAEL